MSHMNRESAEKCCVPRNCQYCGEQTDRDLFGEYRWAHEKCVPKYEPAPLHPSMANPFVRLLYQKMSAISEDCWAAGWMTGNEYALWDALHGDSHRYGWSHISYEELEELRVLSELAGGWISTGPAPYLHAAVRDVGGLEAYFRKCRRKFRRRDSARCLGPSCAEVIRVFTEHDR